MLSTSMNCWKVRWISEIDGEPRVSVVSYTEKGADDRKRLLEAAGHTDVTVFQTKPGTSEPV